MAEYRVERYEFDGTLPSPEHGTPLRIVVHRQGNPGARALSSLAWGDRTDAYTIHDYIDHDGIVIVAIPPTRHAYHVREHRKAEEMGFPTRVSGAGVPRGDVQAIGIELVDARDDEGRIVIPEPTRWSAVYRVADHCREYGLDPMTRVHAHSELDPWTRPEDPGAALPIADFRRDVADVLAGRRPSRTVWRAMAERLSPPLRTADLVRLWRGIYLPGAGGLDVRRLVLEEGETGAWEIRLR